MIENGADLLYAERFGVSDAAKEKGVLAIGNVIDTQADYPDTVVASALWHFEPTLDAAIAEVKAGSFKADDYGVYSFMKEGGCSLAPLGTFEGKVPAGGAGAGRRAARRRSRTARSPSRSTTKSRSRRDADDGRRRRRSSCASTASPNASARWSPTTPSASTCTRRGDRAAGRERRRQDHADEHPVRPLCRRRGHASRCSARPCRRAIRARRWTRASAWCTSISRWPTT